NIRIWKKQKEIQKKKDESDLLRLGFSTFFLNRTNRSGILKAGVIGGLKQKGNWKIDCRYNKKDLIEKIRKIASYKNKIEIYNQDAIELLRNISKKLPKKTLVYLDPPYYIKGKDLYMNHYGPEEHKEVAIGIKNIKQNWIITYDCVPPIEQLYRECKKEKYFLTYSAGNTERGKEIVFFSKGLKNKKSVLKLPSSQNS
ncbi:MAG: DNA adenine methylase, partial [Candidatus Pacearchaeota archaeon]|nr:DNA adenine methylase [Candidatus Pacearchaeota archaeon]